MIKTYNNLYMDIRGEFLRKGIEGASLEALEIVCAAADKDKSQFRRDAMLYAMPNVIQAANRFKERRLAGEPVAYILGEWEFYSTRLFVDNGVLIPRADTEVLARAAIDHVNNRPLRVLDLCTGSGCLAIAIAKNTINSTLVLADNSDKALMVAKKNLRLHKLSTKAICAHLDALTPPPPMLGRFDLVVCNPPYIRTGVIQTLDPSVKNYEPMCALDGGPDGLEFYRKVAQNYTLAIREGGALMFECGFDQSSQVYDILAENGYREIEIINDLQGIGRVVKGCL